MSLLVNRYTFMSMSYYSITILPPLASLDSLPSHRYRLVLLLLIFGFAIV